MRASTLHATLAVLALALALGPGTPAAAQPTGSGDDAIPDAPPEARPAPPAEGVADPLVKPLPLPDPSARVRVGGEPPPMAWQEFDIEGELLEAKETVRAFLEPEMRLRRGALTRQGREEIADYLRKHLGYHLVDVELRRPAPGGPPLLVLLLQPATVVRRVEVDTGSIWERLRNLSGTDIVDAIFPEEIMRRMRLRTGSILARERKDRNHQLEEEAARIADYLRNEGYFEARVVLRDVPDARHQVVLRVDIQPGPRYKVGRIQVVGNTAVDTREILEQFHHARVCILEGIIGELGCYGELPFSRQQLNKDERKVVELYQRRGYPGVRVRTDFDLRHSFKRDTRTVEFTVTVNERRKIDVVFMADRDDRWLPEDRLRELLTFSQEGAYDEVEVQASAEAIRRFYQTQGHFEANVTWERLRFGFFDRIIYTIAPGPRLKVKAVTFEGNRTLSDAQLAEVVKTTVFRSLALFGDRGGYVTSLQIQQDVERIRELYRVRGFVHADVRARVNRDQRLRGNSAAVAAAVAAELPASDLFIRFLIDEGPREVVGDVQFHFKGEHTITEAELRQQITLRPGLAYFEGRASDAVTKLQNYLAQRARPHAEVTLEVRPGARPHTTDIIFHVEERHRVRLGKVVLRGNFRTRDWVIRDALGYDEGDLLTMSRIDRAQTGLRNTGLFNAVQINYVNYDDRTQHTTNVVVHVEERHQTGADGYLAGGISSDTGTFIELGAKVPNIFGVGLQWDFRGTIGTEEESSPSIDNIQLFGETRLIAPKWIARRYLGLGMRAEASVSYRREITERFGPLTTLGTSVGVSRAGRAGGFFEGWLLSVRYDFRQRNRQEELIRSAGASDDLNESPVRTRTSAPVVQLVIDKRRDEQGRINPLTPVSGFKLDLRAMYAEDALFGSDSFVKFGVGAHHFWRPANRLLFSHGIRYDHGIPFPLGRAVLPEVERFFAGGDTTVRGFEEDRLATEVIEQPLPPLGETTRIRVLPAGGNIRFLHNLDLQVEVWEVFGFPVASAIFLDTGIVTNSLDGFTITDLRHAVGLALIRWLSPIGSLSVEWAIPLDPKPGDDPRGRFHFNFGLLF